MKQSTLKTPGGAGTKLLMGFSFLGFVNTLCLFHMDGRVPNSKWKRTGWIALFVNLFLLVCFIAGVIFMDATVGEYPSASQPSVQDYVENYNGLSYDEYKDLPEYKEYQKDYKKWQESDEYKAYRKANDTLSSAMRALRVGALIASFLINLVFFFYIMSQRADFYRQLHAKRNRNDLARRLDPQPAAYVPPAPSPRPAEYTPQQQYPQGQQYPQARPQPPFGQPQPAAPEGAVDVNSASVEMLAALPGLTEIDARRAVSVRESKGPFASADAFFDAINAPPHIVVRLSDKVCAAPPAAAQPAPQEGPAEPRRRTLDL